MSSGDWLEQKCHPVKLGIGEAGFGTRKLLIFFELTLEWQQVTSSKRSILGNRNVNLEFKNEVWNEDSNKVYAVKREVGFSRGVVLLIFN